MQNIVDTKPQCNAIGRHCSLQLVGHTNNLSSPLAHVTQVSIYSIIQHCLCHNVVYVCVIVS